VEEEAMRNRLAVVSLCVLLVVALTGAQSLTQTLSGTVTDETQSVLPGATVTVKSDAHPARQAITDQHGRFTISGLLPGTYTVTCQLEGFIARTLTVTIEEDRAATVAVVMKVGGVTETVMVSSASAIISAQTASIQGVSLLTPFKRANYKHIPESDFRRVSAHPLSTFSIDADTASYANVRRFLRDGELPPHGAVRIEELINYFRFDYPAPRGGAPIGVSTELARCAWNDKHMLALVGVRAADLPARQPLARNLVFLIDVSGSMASEDKLPLVQKSLHLLTDRLTERDRVGMVVYAGSSGMALPSTPGSDKPAIHAAIENLEAGGRTNGAEGIRLAYQLAREQFRPDGVNRVILATDGDFNVGVTSEDELVRMIERERKSGVFLSVLGVGTDNLQDGTMEALADKGNGNYAYLDSLQEANKVLVRESDSTLVTVAKDVKIQIEFNPRRVAAYRLIGYENRLLDDQDFNDDAKDAGEVGAGHTVTALYEIVPVGVALPGTSVDPLKYQRPAERRNGREAEWMTVKVRYKQPDGGRSQRMEMVVDGDAQPLTRNLGFASAVGEFGMLLRESRHAGEASFDRVVERAKQFRGDDPHRDRAEFIALAERAGQLRRAKPSTGQ
jgi:Ca-activated chloride channel homolog